MARSILFGKLTKDYIESKISQESIMSKYLNIPLDVIIDCINHNTLIRSVFRDDDNNKSMGFTFNKKGKLKVRDFGGFGFFGDVYDVVGYVLSIMLEREINPNKKEDFYLILKHIAYTFKNVMMNKEVDKNLTKSIVNAINKGKSNKAIIELVTRPWNNNDKNIWNHWGVSLNYLNTHFVLPVEQYYINRKLDDNPKYYYDSKDPCYAYVLGKNQQGITLIKLYFPLRKKDKELKFITNCNVLEGLPNLELDNYDYILITKSSKDRLSIGSHLSANPFYGGLYANLKIGIINLPSEVYKLKQNEYEYLKNKLNSNGKLITLFDFDTTGRMAAKYHKEVYDIPYIFITRGEFQLNNFKGKDFADLHDYYSINQINEFIKDTITFIKLKYDTDVKDSEGFEQFGFLRDSIPYY